MVPVQSSKTSFYTTLQVGSVLHMRAALEPTLDDIQSQSRDRSFRIVEELSTGSSSYGHSYKACEICPEDQTRQFVFIKIPRIAKEVSRTQLQHDLSAISSSFSEEIRNADRIAKLNRNGKVAAELIGDGLFIPTDAKLKHLRIPFLVHEFIDSKNMIEWLSSYHGGAFLCDGEFRGITRPELWFQLANDITDIVRRIHNQQIVHGDIAPKNILIREEGDDVSPMIVDFGRSFQLDLSSVAGSQLRRENPYVAPESRDERFDWYTPADIYALGGVLFYMATGYAPPDVMKMQGVEGQTIFKDPLSWAAGNHDEVDRWKEFIHKQFANNPLLVARHEGIIKIVDKCLRPRPSERYSTSERVLHGLDAVNYSARSRRDVSTQIGRLRDLWENVDEERFDGLFANILHDKLELIAKEVEDMQRQHFEIYGEREELIDTLIKYMGTLGQGDCYLTVTVPSYWTRDNLGVNGRFLTVNRDLVKNGAFINRVFLLCQDDLRLDETRKILRAHLRTWENLAEGGHQAVVPTFGPEGDVPQGAITGQMFVGAMILPSREHQQRAQRQNSHVAVWRKAKAGVYMSITFESQPLYEPKDELLTEVGSKIVKVRFRQLTDSEEYDTLRTTVSHTDVVPLNEVIKD